MGLTKPRAHQLQDIDYKQTTRAVTISNVTLSGGAPATVDGVSLTLRDRVLVTGQSTGSENGIYYVTTVGAGSNGTWERSLDADTTGEVSAGMIIMVTEGTTYADTQWKLTTDDPITIGTTSLTFVRNGNAAYGTVAVSGEDSIVADAIGDTLTVASGNNISLTTNASTDTLTVAVSDTITTTGNVTGGNLIATSGLSLGGTAVTATATELNLLDGVTGITLGTANEILIVGSDNTSIEGTDILTIDTASNYVGINQTSPEVTLHMTGEGAQTAQIRMEQYNDSADAPDVRTRRYRGTIASPAAVQSGDYLFRSNHEYYNGTSLLVGGAFAFDNTNNAARTQFSVAVDTDGTGADPQGTNGQFKIDGNDGGAITFNNAYKFPTSDGSANQILATDGSGVLSFTGSPTFTGLTVDTNTLYVDSANNRIGIGTTSPAYQVEIENTGNNALLVLDRTDGAATFIEGGDTASVLGSVGANDVKIAYNSIPVVSIGASGAITVNNNFTFPTTDGSANQVLQTDGSGTLSFADASGGGATVSSDTTTNTNFLLYFASTTTGALTAVKQDSGLTYNPSTGLLTSAAFSGSGASLTSLNGSNISTGTVAAARVATLNQNTTGTAGGLSSAVTVELTGPVTGSATFTSAGDTASIATTLTADPVITLTGAVTGSATMTNLGNVSIATTATSDPTITLTGDVTGSGTMTNLGNVSFATTIAANSVALGTDTTGNYVGTITGGTGINSSGATSGEGVAHTLSIDSTVATLTGSQTLTNKTLTSPVISTISNTGTLTLPTSTGTIALTSDIPTNNNQLTNGAGYTTNVGDITNVTVSGTGLSGGGASGSVTITSNATNANTASTIVARDASGDFSAGTITASLTGTASNAALLDNVDSSQFLRSDVADTKTSGNLSFNDSVKAVFGSGDDLTIHHEPGFSIIREQNANPIFIQTDNTQYGVSITKKFGAEVMAYFIPDGAVYLYHNNALKLATTATGIQVVGNITNYSGDFTLDVAGDITLDADGGDIKLSDGGTVFGELTNSASYFVIKNPILNQDIEIKGNDGGSEVTALRFDMSDAGTAVFNHDITLPDNGKAIFGAGSDLQIYHDGSNSYIADSGTGSLYIRGTDIFLQDAEGNNFIHLDDTGTGGTVTLYHNASAKLATSATGVTITGVMSGTATSARYADLAEKYTSDQDYEPGTVVELGGEYEVTQTHRSRSTAIAGIVSTNPAHLMNDQLEAEHVVDVALIGRVPCKVVGQVRKGDLLISSDEPGHAQAYKDIHNPPTGSVIGKAIESKDTEEPGVIEVLVGRL